VGELSKVSEYAKEIPNELREGVKGLDHEVRQAVVALLMRNPDLSFTEIANSLGISKSQLSHHLDILLDSALVRNFSKAELKGPFDSYYGLTNFGRGILEALGRVLQPTFETPDWKNVKARIYLSTSTVVPLEANTVSVSFLSNLPTALEVKDYAIRSKRFLLDSVNVSAELVGGNRPLLTDSDKKPMEQIIFLTAKSQKTSALS